MKIIQTSDTTFTAETEIGTFTGYVSSEAQVHISTPYVKGVVQPVTIRKIDYKVSLTLNENGVGNGYCFVGRVGSYKQDATPKSHALIWQVGREVNKAVRALPTFKDMVLSYKKKDIQRHIQRIQEEINDKKEEIAKLEERLNAL